MIKHIFSAVLGLSLAAGAVTFALAFTRGGVWLWADPDGTHVMTGHHPPEARRLAPHPLWYVACAGVVPLGVLLALRQIPPWEMWTGRALDVYFTGFVGLATSAAGVYMIVGTVLVLRDRNIAEAEVRKDSAQSNGSAEAAERDVEIDLDIQGKAKENATSFLLGLLSPSLRAIAVGLFLLATGVPALIALPEVVRGRTDEGLIERLATVPAMTLLLILFLIIAWVAVIIMFGLLSLTGWPAWACVGLAAATVLAAIFAGLMIGLYPSWSAVTQFAREFLDD